MRTYILVISRLVPVLLLASGCLIAGRFLYDWLSRRGRPRTAFAAFAALLIAGAGISGLLIARVSYLAAGISELLGGETAAGDAALGRYVALGGHVDPQLALDWADGLMQAGRFADARRVLFAAAGRRGGRLALSRAAVLAIGECFYYEGNLRQAEGALRVATGTPREYLRHYFLGRIDEKRAALESAAGEYEASLAASAEFFPAFYAATRLQFLRGDRDGARRRIDLFRREHPEAAQHPLMPSLDAAARSQAGAPPDVEFHVFITA